MKLICKFSGITLADSPADTIPVKLAGAHPVFQLGREAIYSLMRKYPASAEFPVRKRLYFLGLLHSTNLTLWDTAFAPDDETVANSFPSLLHFLQSFPIAPTDAQIARFPRIRISECNDIAEVIKNWRMIASGLAQVRTVPEATANADLALAQKEIWNQVRLEKLEPKYLAFLEFQLANCEADDDIVEDWLAMLRKPVAQTTQKDYNKLLALKDTLADCLPVTDASRQKSFFVLRFVQNKLDEATKQQAAMLGCAVEKVAETLANVSTFKIVLHKPEGTSGTEETKQRGPMPQVKDFANMADYAKAKAEWFANK